jgi:hypothetical protein
MLFHSSRWRTPVRSRKKIKSKYVPLQDSGRAHRRPLVLLFLVALAVRTLRAVQIPVVNPDAMRFILQAQRMPVDFLDALRSEAYHPLHAFLAFLLHAVIASNFPSDREAWLFAVQSIGVICGSIVALQMFWLSRAFGAPRWASLAAAAAWIVGRRTSVYGADGIADMLFLSLFAASLLTAISAMRIRTLHLTRRQALQFALAGLLSGLSYLARPEGLGAILIVAIAMTLTHISSHRRNIRRSIRRKFLPRHPIPLKPTIAALTCMFLGAALPSVPYMLAIGAFTHKKTLSLTAISLHATPLAAAFTATGSPLEKLMKLLTELMETFGFAPGIAILGAMLLAPWFWGRPRLRPLVVTWLAVWTLLMIWLMSKAGYLDGRHTLPLELVLYGLLALAFVVWTKPMRWWMNWWRSKPTWDRLPPWMRWPRWPYAFAGGAIFLTLLPGLILLRVPPQEEQAIVRNAATWARTHIRPSIPIYDHERLIAFYSNHPLGLWRGTPDHPALDTLPKDAPCLISYIFRPSKGEQLQFAIGPYQSIALFKSPVSAGGDVLMIYAIPGQDVFLDAPAYTLPPNVTVTTIPATAPTVH